MIDLCCFCVDVARRVLIGVGGSFGGFMKFISHDVILIILLATLEETVP